MKNNNTIAAAANFLALIVFSIIWATSGGIQAVISATAVVVISAVLTYTIARDITAAEKKELTAKC